MTEPALPVRAVLIGASPRALVRYGALFDHLSGVELVAAVEWDSKRVAAFKRRWPTLPVFTSQDQVRQAVPHDLVFVASPAACHFSATKEALRAGKHVLCEPPLALMPSDVHNALHDAHERGLVLSSGLRRTPALEALAARSPGPPVSITLRWDVPGGRLPRADLHVPNGQWHRLALQLGSHLLPFVADLEPVGVTLPGARSRRFSALFRGAAGGEIRVSAEAATDRGDGSCLARIEWADAPPTELDIPEPTLDATAALVDRVLDYDPVVEADRREDEIWVAQLACGWEDENPVDLVGGGPPISRYRGTRRPRY